MNKHLAFWFGLVLSGIFTVQPIEAQTLRCVGNTTIETSNTIKDALYENTSNEGYAEILIIGDNNITNERGFELYGDCSSDEYAIRCSVDTRDSRQFKNLCKTGNPKISIYSSSLKISRGDGLFSYTSGATCIFGESINAIRGILITRKETIGSCEVFDPNKKKF